MSEDITFERSLSWKFGKKYDRNDLSRKQSTITALSWVEMIHGLELYLKIKNKKFKVSWIIFLIISSIVSIYLTAYTVLEYFDEKTITLFTVKRTPTIPYHAMTFCPKFSDSYNVTSIKNMFYSIDKNMSEGDFNDLMIFLSAGGGFDDYQDVVKTFDDDKYRKIEEVFSNIVSYFGSIENVYHYIFNEENFKCEDFFQECYFGDIDKDCCEMFEEKFVLLRGKCFSMKMYNQTAPDEMDKLSLVLKPISSYYMESTGIQEQIIVYNSPRGKYIAVSPRYYIYGRDWNRFKFERNVYKLLKGNSNCNSDDNYDGFPMCFIDSWLEEKLYNPYNCTFFYMTNSDKKYDICEPMTIVKNYSEIMTMKLQYLECLQACNREEITTDLVTRPYNYNLAGIKIDKNSRIRIEISYLRMEEYYYQEVGMTTPSGFISEIGGHTGLFVGITMISVVQIIFKVSKYLYEEFSVLEVKNRNGVGL
uniref:Acid-sensing ion channel 1 n=1 Tax=Parastrongyloides trichosuri TaxID=131310 RepID=A0A0N4ZE46_PARTI